MAASLPQWVHCSTSCNSRHVPDFSTSRAFRFSFWHHGKDSALRDADEGLHSTEKLYADGGSTKKGKLSVIFDDSILKELNGWKGAKRKEHNLPFLLVKHCVYNHCKTLECSPTKRGWGLLAVRCDPYLSRVCTGMAASCPHSSPACSITCTSMSAGSPQQFADD